MAKDLLDEGHSWLASQQRNFQSREVTYRRGNSSVVVLATKGASVFEDMTEAGYIQRFESHDEIIRVVDLPFGLPEVGDEIVVGSITYTVLIPSSGGVPYKQDNAHSIRIFTKRTE